MSKEGQPVFIQLFSLARLVTPGDAAKDTFLAGVGFTPALFFARIEGALLVTLILGVLNMLVIAFFRGVELYLKYIRAPKVKHDPDSPRQS